MARQEMDSQVSALRSMMSRRGFFGAAGAVGAASVLAACGTGGGSANPSASFPADTSAADKLVRWANWTLYLDVDKGKYPTLETFKKQTGINVDYREDVDDNNSFWGKVNGQLRTRKDIGYDIVTLTDWMANRMIQYGYTQPLDAAKVPNKSNILTALANVAFDPGRQRTLTWQSGFAGLVWNKEKLPKGLKTIDDLWQPALKGKVTVLSEMRDTVGCLLLSQGVDITKPISDAQFATALELLSKQLSSGQIYKVQGNQYKNDLINGTAWAGILWSGDIFQLNAENGDKWGFALPESGGTLWSDNMMIPSTSSHQTDAMKLMNYYYEPAVAAKVAAYVNYICPVQGAQAEMEKIDPKLAASEFIFPSADTLARAKTFVGLEAAQETSFNDQWLTAIGQ
ncbi:MAG: spermidine/putrescine ABC transporter substrate-binding protein [Actinobacteria bacterium]|nr:spermidine/putrescine ABC transporter substrate-binding protein [Actinomycetota bacterium]